MKKTIPLILFLSILTTSGGAEQPVGAPAYQFEGEARPMLEKIELPKSRDPKLALRASGAIYMLAVYGDREPSQLGLASSNDGGDSFSPPVPISDKEARVTSHGENSPSLAFGKTEVYSLWEQHRTGGGTDLMFSRSTNFGRKFEKPIRVTDKTEPSTNGFSYMAAAPNGYVYAVWLDGRDPGQSDAFSVYLARSVDRGATFEKNIRVSKGACPCCRPTLAFGSKGEVYVAWRTVYEGDIRDMVLSASYDDGKSFSAPVRVAVDNWKIEGCPHSGASMISNGDRLYMAWYSEGGGRSGLRISWSDDGGKTFSAPLMASGKILDANHPAFSTAESGRLLLLFQGRAPVKKGNWNSMQPFLIEIDSKGRLSRPMPIPGRRNSISYPALAAGTAGRVYFAWTEPADSGHKIFFTRGRRDGF